MDVCRYCQTSSFSEKRIECQAHEVHLRCILKELTRFLNEDSCKYCRSVILEIKDSNQCSLCPNRKNNDKKKCKMNNYLCDSCIQDFQNTQFCKDCVVCKLKENRRLEQLEVQDRKQEMFPEQNSLHEENKHKKNKEKLLDFNLSQKKHQSKSSNSQTMQATKESSFHSEMLMMDIEKQSSDGKNTEETLKYENYDKDIHNENKYIFFYNETPTIPKCSICNKPAFLANSCNHNYCESCLNDLVCSSSSNFISFFENKEVLKIESKFLIKCKYLGCSKIFKLPFNLMQKIHPLLERFSKFTIYFEGGRTNFKVCDSCKSVIGYCGKVKLGCDCL